MIIGPSKYSKDPMEKPEGIMLTLPKVFFEDRKWDYVGFNKMFEKFMSHEGAIWNFKLTNLPKHDIGWVYLCYNGFVQFRVNFVQYERNVSKMFADGPKKAIRKFPNANWVILTGPAVKPPYEWPQKGFQGFRYTTYLF